MTFDSQEMAVRIAGRVQASEKEAAKTFRMQNLKAMMSLGKRFGIISAYQGVRSKSKNQDGTGDLIADLNRMGYRNLRRVSGSWEGKTEKSILIPDIPFKDLVDLCVAYDQDAVVYKTPDNVIGMYSPKTNTATIAMKPDGDMAWRADVGQGLYSKSRGISFEFDFLFDTKIPWHRGQPPISRAQAEEIFSA